jgi:hypothetical protein
VWVENDSLGFYSWFAMAGSHVGLGWVVSAGCVIDLAGLDACAQDFVLASGWNQDRMICFLQQSADELV